MMRVVCVVAPLANFRPIFYILLPAERRELNGKYKQTFNLTGHAHNSMASAVLTVRHRLRARYMQQWNRRADCVVNAIRIPVGVCS